MADPVEPEQRRLGPFQLEDRLGVGGMGIVYRAKYLKTGQKVAVKVLAPDLSNDFKVAKRFDREMDILKRLNHPNIIRYYGGSSTGIQRFYAMELVNGGSLEQLLRKKKRFGWEETVDYCIQISKALEHAHNAGVIHRDLKPGNLLLTRKNVLKLSDFGIARDTQATQLTAAGKTVGTMAYMAPEQITGKTPINRRTDLYALGCVMFQMLTGRTPFGGSTQPEMLFKHIDEIPPSVRDFNVDVPEGLEKLIAELLEKDPNERPYDALAVQVKLEEIKKEVAEQMAFLKQQTSADSPAALTVANAEAVTRASLSTKKKKKNKGEADLPIWERTWFLVAALVGLVALFVWGFWPEGEDHIYARIQPLMIQEETKKWFEAEIDLKKLVEKFPNGAHAKEAQAWLDDIHTERIQIRAERDVDRSREGDSTVERLYLAGRMQEKSLKLTEAQAKFEELLRVTDAFTDESKKTEARPYVNLARRRLEKIQATHQLEQGDSLFNQGDEAGARAIWQRIIDDLSSRKHARSVVEDAKLRIANPAQTVPKPREPVPEKESKEEKANKESKELLNEAKGLLDNLIPKERSIDN